MMQVKSIIATAAVGCLIVGAMTLADQDRRVKLISTGARSIDNSDFREVMPKAWDIMETDGVPGIPEAGIVMQSMEQGAVYLDDAGNVLMSRRTGRSGWCDLSPDGGILAFMGTPTLRTTESLPDEMEPIWLRVEKVTGELVWERKDGLGIGETTGSIFSVTNRGHVVVHSNIRGPGRETASGKITHPLIFDSKGDLVAQLPARFYHGRLSLSKDGAYCAINFADLDAESPARCSGGLDSARQCLALFEVGTGRELWRHYFEHCESGSVTLTEKAERVICAVREAEWVEANQRYLGTHSLYVFDRQGKIISRVDTKGPLGPFALSPNERFTSVPVLGRGEDDVLIIDPLDGRAVAEWSCKPRCHAYVFSVSDSATTAVRVRTSHPSGETSTSTYQWVLIDAQGTAIYEEPYEEDNRPFVLLSADGKSLSKIRKGGIEQYVLEEQ